MNPPLVGVLCGIAIGFTPLGLLLFCSGTPSAEALLHSLPLELQLCTGGSGSGR